MINQTKQFLIDTFQLSEKQIDFVEACEQDCEQTFRRIESIAELNQAKVLKAFQTEQIATRHFAQSTGYGYDDIGRDALERVFANAFGAEDALVRPQIASGTHALSLMLFGLLSPGDEMLSVTSKPYDTLEESIGIRGNAWGSLKSLGVSYEQMEFLPNGAMDIDEIANRITKKTRLVYLQRSRGYSWRNSLTIADIKEVVAIVKKIDPTIYVAVDNCYGEFTDALEPTDVGIDVMAGSLIKNPGGGLAPTGGYIAGRTACIDKIANRLTSPGIGREVGSYAGGYLSYYQGFFLAPHVTAQTIKGATLAARVYEQLGFSVLPSFDVPRNDIIQSIGFDTKEQLISFCQAIQAAAPIDSHVTPEPWAMPGYEDPVIMAAGAFIQGSSIELSADAPIREPYIAYMQGGLTYEHVKLAVLLTLKERIK